MTITDREPATAEDAFNGMPLGDPSVIALRSEQRFGLVDRLQILLSGRVALEQRVYVVNIETDGKKRMHPCGGSARWTTNWPWRWGRA